MSGRDKKNRLIWQNRENGVFGFSNWTKQDMTIHLKNEDGSSFEYGIQSYKDYRNKFRTWTIDNIAALQPFYRSLTAIEMGAELAKFDTLISGLYPDMQLSDTQLRLLRAWTAYEQSNPFLDFVWDETTTSD